MIALALHVIFIVVVLYLYGMLASEQQLIHPVPLICSSRHWDTQYCVLLPDFRLELVKTVDGGIRVNWKVLINLNRCIPDICPEVFIKK